MRCRAKRIIDTGATGPRRESARRSGACQRFAAAASLAVLLPAAAAAQNAAQPPAAGSAPAPAGITFFTGADFTGASKTLTLSPEQPYAAIPFVGDELNEKIASLRAD
ncbi:MAG: hypothetical protein RH942_18705, partial [Kiloniellaceae bacterium]